VRDRGLAGVFVDVSGSVGPGELAAFLGELGGILRDADLPVRLITWDTAVLEDLQLDSAESLHACLDARRFRLRGGGGTDPACIIGHLDGPEGADLPLPSFGVLLTDGLVPWPEAEAWPLPLLVASVGPLPPPSAGYDSLSIPVSGALS
jgi:predicted metal-dependent peptidase